MIGLSQILGENQAPVHYLFYKTQPVSQYLISTVLLFSKPHWRTEKIGHAAHLQVFGWDKVIMGFSKRRGLKDKRRGEAGINKLSLSPPPCFGEYFRPLPCVWFSFLSSPFLLFSSLELPSFSLSSLSFCRLNWPASRSFCWLLNFISFHCVSFLPFSFFD